MIGTLINGRFRLEEQIGSGGMSTVYRAFDEVLERSVAIKVMHASIQDDDVQLERFRREARTAAKIAHPHVVTVIDAGEDDGHPFIVLEYVEGETLKDRIKRVGPLPVAEAVAYAIEVGRGLAAAHNEHLVHRDVKPQNVLIDPEGRAKLTDFGISRSLLQDGLTATGRVLGTTDYVSPEQALGEVVTEQSDVYSLGVCLYEMLTGEVPYKAESQVGVAMKHVRDPMPDPQQKRPEMSAALAAVVEHSTAKELKNRYATVAEMLADLEQALAIEVARSGHPTGEATSVIRALPRAQTDVLPRRLRSPRLWSITIILVGVGIALIMVGLAMRTEPDDQPVAGPKPAPPPPTAVTITEASAFDPPPDGDGKEHDDEAARAIDRDPSTKWTTENYTQGQGLANKPGVGLYVMAEEPVAAKKMGIVSSAGGADIEVFGAAEPGEALADWGEPIGRRNSAPRRAEIELDTRGQKYGYYLIWFTKLPPTHKGDIARVTIVR